VDTEGHRVGNGPVDLDVVRLGVKMGNGSMIPIIGAFLGDEAATLSIEFCCSRLQYHTWI